MTTRQRILVTITGALLAAVLATAAYAAFTATGTGGGTAQSATMPSVQNFTLTYGGGRTVGISWAAEEIADTDLAEAGGEYRVTQYDTLDASSGREVCVTAETSCSDRLPSGGQKYYSVQTVLHNWTGQASAFKDVTVTLNGPSITPVHPTNGGQYQLADWDALCGSATGGVCGAVEPDTDTEITSTEVAVRNAGGASWDGSEFSTTDQTFHPVDVADVRLALPSTALTVGDYVASFRATDDAGETNTVNVPFSIVDVPVEKFVPTVTISSPTSVSQTETTVYYAGSTDGIEEYHRDITIRVYSGTNTSVAPLRTHTAARPTLSSWSYDDTVPLDPGTYTIIATQACKCSADGVSNRVTLTIATPLPAVTITWPMHGGATNDNKPSFSGTAGSATGDSGTIEVKLYQGTAADGTPVKSYTTTRTASSTWSVTYGPGSPLSVGYYTLQASHAGSGGTSTATSTFRVDTSAPVVTVTAPTTGLRTNDRRITVAGTAGTADGDSPTVHLQLSHGTTTVLTEQVAHSNGTWSFTPPADLIDGNYTAAVTQTDDAGHTSASVTRSFEIDTTPPSVTLSSPAANTVTTTARPVFSGTAGNAAGDLTTVNLKVYSGDVAAGTPLIDQNVSRSGAGWTFTPTTNLSDGRFTAVATQSDGLQATTTTPATFRIDATAPAIHAVTAPGANGLITAGDKLLFEFNEALDPASLPGTPTNPNVAMTMTRGNSSSLATLTIAGVSASGSTGVQGWAATGTTITWQGSVRLLSDGKTIEYTVGACATNCADNKGNSNVLAGGSGSYSYIAASTLRDLAGNGANTSSRSFTLTLF